MEVKHSASKGNLIRIKAEQARRIAANIAKLPELLSRKKEGSLMATPFLRALDCGETISYRLFEGVRVQPTLSFELGYGLKLVGVSLRVSLNP
jgi:hypothetical protein